jgi:integrase
VTILDPYWFPKAPTGKRIQSFGFSLFKWLQLNKYYFDQNPFDGRRGSPMVEGLGGSQPPGGNRNECEPNDLPLIMAQLRAPPSYGEDVWTAAEVAEASERDIHAVRLGCKGRGKKHPPIFPNAYRWAPWGTAPYLIPGKDLRTPLARKMFPLKRPLRKHNEVSIESLALQFALLTCVRSGMACDLQKRFIHEKLDLITYPKDAHKEGEQLNDEYNVLYTPAVKDVIAEAEAYQKRHGIESDYVFVKGLTRTGLSDRLDELVKQATLWHLFKMLLARVPEIEKPHTTLHEVRTAVTEWACDRNDWPVTVVDVMLGHVIKGIRNRSYFRNVRQRQQIRELMIDWQKFLLQVEAATVEAVPWRSQPSPLSKEGKPLRPWQVVGK